MEFEMGDSIICVKQFGRLEFGSIYKIEGCGDLEWNNATDKIGYGFNIPFLDYDFPNRKSIRIDYFFTEKEMSKYFIKDDYYKRYMRDEKINSILNEGN
jgi:hypothetical protein